MMGKSKAKVSATWRAECWCVGCQAELDHRVEQVTDRFLATFCGLCGRMEFVEVGESGKVLNYRVAM